jgi:predicted PurR-regulated permease PerM
MVPTRTAHAALVILAVLALLLLLTIALPFATPLFLAAVLAGAVGPWMERLSEALGGRRKAAAAILTALVVIAFLGPLSGFGAVVVPQMVAGFAWLRSALQGEGLTDLIRRTPDWLRPVAESVHRAIPETLDRLQAVATTEGGRAAAVLGNLLSATGSFVLRTILMLIAFFFLLVDGPALVRWVNDVAPLKRGQVSELLRDFRKVTVTVLVSTVAVAAVQTVLALLGYLVAGVPNVLFFVFATFFLGLVPLVGATVVVLVVAVVQIVNGHVVAGIALAVWAVGVIGMVDNVLKPIFIRGSVQIHGAVIFFALFGGLAAFGPVGFLVGPLAVSFLVAVIRMYRRDYGGHAGPNRS